MNPTQQATRQLNPVYQQQAQAVRAQIPAIQQLYQSLFQGLEGTRQTETQNIFEGASGRGLLNSTIPVDQQTQLGQQLLQQRGQLGAQQAQDIAGVQSSLQDINVQRASAISELANALAGRRLERRKLQLNRAQQQRELHLQRVLADRQHALDVQRAQRGF